MRYIVPPDNRVEKTPRFYGILDFDLVRVSSKGMDENILLGTPIFKYGDNHYFNPELEQYVWTIDKPLGYIYSTNAPSSYEKKTIVISNCVIDIPLNYFTSRDDLVLPDNINVQLKQPEVGDYIYIVVQNDMDLVLGKYIYFGAASSFNFLVAGHVIGVYDYYVRCSLGYYD